MFDSDRTSWQNPKVLITLLMVFLCGAVTGMLAMREWLHGTLHKPPQNVLFVGSSGGALSFERVKKELSLTPQQADQIKSILDDFVKYHEDLQNQIEDVRATGKNRIMTVLDDNQKQRFEQICLEVQPR